MEDLRQKVVAELFATHPSVNVFYVTSDNTGFTEDHRAEAHGQSLKDKEIETCHRRDFETAKEVKKITKDKAPVTPVKETETPTTSGDSSETGKGADDQGAGASSEAGAAGSEQKETSEKEALQARYLELYGKKPNHLTGVEKLKADIAAKEAQNK